MGLEQRERAETEDKSKTEPSHNSLVLFELGMDQYISIFGQ